MSAAIVAFGAVSPLGRGERALGVGDVGEVALVASFASPELTAAGLARPFAAELSGYDAGTDRAARILASALTDVARSLDDHRPGWRALRVGLAIGTSSGAMRRVEAIARDLRAGKVVDRETARAVLYASPLHEALREALPDQRFAAFSLVLGACASSTMAVGLGMRWLDAGTCDLVLAGGFDGQSVLVSAGFEALHATTSAAPPRPFHPGRDGLALGEGAAVLALGPAADGARAVVGFGVTCDAFHVTAPDRGGEGLARAAERALADGGIDGREIDLVSAHGTATSFNDAAEALALSRVCTGSPPDVHAYKSQSGHTLGAAGALELLAADAALARQVVPASGGASELSEVRVAERAHARALRSSLKLSAAFGGANAALVLGTSRASSRPARSSRPVFATRAVFVPLDAPLPELNEIKLARFDALTRGTVAAVHALGAAVSGDGAGLIVGHTLASFETNMAYAARIDERGVRAAEPRRFPYTSPNACAGEAAIAFGIRGPVFAVGGGWNGGLEALVVACALVAAGDAESITVVAVDAPGEAWARLGEPVPLRPGAVALRVTAAAAADGADGSSRLRVTLAESSFDPASTVKMSLAPGHQALLPLVAAGSGARLLESRCLSGAVARVRLDPV